MLFVERDYLSWRALGQKFFEASCLEFPSVFYSHRLLTALAQRSRMSFWFLLLVPFQEFGDSPANERGGRNQGCARDLPQFLLVTDTHKDGGFFQLHHVERNCTVWNHGSHLILQVTR